jgi:thiamine biosynthesis lipoprotein
VQHLQPPECTSHARQHAMSIAPLAIRVMLLWSCLGIGWGGGGCSQRHGWGSRSQSYANPNPSHLQGTEQQLAFIAPAMGVQVRIVLCCPTTLQDAEGLTLAQLRQWEPSPSAAAAAKAAFARIAELELCMSDYRPDSELSRLCDRAGEGPVQVSDDLFCVLKRAQEISAASDGAFDVTIGPVTALWRQFKAAGNSTKMPGPHELAAAHQLVNWRNVVLDETRKTVTLLKRGMRLDLGAIGKGYAGDCAVAVLRQRGFARCVVDVGGDLVIGDPPSDQPVGINRAWRVAIGPGEFLHNMAPNSPTTTLYLRNCAVATSGDAEQQLQVQGVQHAHIIDPQKTGDLGLSRGAFAVTVVAPDGATADALATAVSVLGPARSARLVEKFPSTAARFVQFDPTTGRHEAWRLGDPAAWQASADKRQSGRE